MKKKILRTSAIFILIVNSFLATAQVNIQDSLALVDLYNSTNGPGWRNHTNWLTIQPINSWYGVVLVQNGRVVWLELKNNKLIGSVPSSLGNLSAVSTLRLSFNQLSGGIPSTLGNLKEHSTLDLSYNQLGGTIPKLKSATIYNNRFTFSGLEGVGIDQFSGIYSPQSDIPIIKDGNTLSVAAGGTLAKNTYKWYKDNLLISTKTGDSTFSVLDNGNYSVIVTNSVATQLSLYSINTINTQDSLALVDLYNSTNGPGWINSNNWLTKIPACNWFGITARNNRVKEIQLISNNLLGTIPSSLGNLSGLISLTLRTNSLGGTIPVSIGNLSNLVLLDLLSNQLNGNIPASLGNLTNLTSLGLDSNKLSGNIPASLENLSNLKGLSLANNLLNGNVPDFLGNLTNLTSLFLSENQFSGTIPPSLGRLSNLNWLSLEQNQLSGIIPDSLTFLSNLVNLYLQENQLSGNIPDSVTRLTKLQTLMVYNNHLTGSIPSLSNLPLFYLWIYNNAFTFDGMENLPAAYFITYSPQANIPLNRSENLLSVSAGGTLANDTFRLYKDGVLNTTQIGDSTFDVTTNGGYYITVTNSIATQLTLKSDSVNLILTYHTLADGNWNNPAIWEGGVVPPSTAQVVITNKVILTQNTTCYSLKIEPPNGDVTVQSGVTLTVIH